MDRFKIFLRPDFAQDVLEEMDRQDEKWGDQSGHSGAQWCAILLEEVGEATKLILDSGGMDAPLDGGDRAAAEIREELIQVMAVTAQMVRVLDGWGLDV